MYILVKTNNYGVDHIACASTEEKIKQEIVAGVISALYAEEEIEINKDITEFFKKIKTEDPIEIADKYYDKLIKWIRDIDGCNAENDVIWLSKDGHESHEWIEFSYYNSDYHMA